ncbi:MAG: 5'/3'-nucleotidase SurE [Oceanospirillaceae bacterium]|nr:5'/3'-nucleotidase SurE [Oceanospirillaceae bacterium]MBT12976.1 5'/3'-nucleotidase SurE [Oceanospirillaceae bacterium]|tara:strand:- start:48798 stop:49538 length:741 start_codon:yes stop_codon:yes gene_type:complete
MKLMLSNDDGVHAPGLRTLRQSLEQAGYGICVVAPDRDRSGASNSLTLDRPLHPVHLDADVISVNGTPTDCVHLGINAFYADQCERVIAGINAGANLGDDVIYSGTVAAAMEGRFLSKTPVAVSLCGKTYFATAAQALLDLIPRLEQLQLPANSIININVPDRPYTELTGIEVTRLGHRHRSDNPVLTTNPRGKECYWISAAGAFADDGPGTDIYAVEQGKVSVTPIQMDMTQHTAIPAVTEVIEN